MSYEEWYETHAQKHAALVAKLLAQGFSQEEIIDYFKWENMVQEESDFCLLFAEHKKCHAMEHLNCYLCGCPYFRFDDHAPLIKSHCTIDAKQGKSLHYQGVVHQDCSACIVPHTKKFIAKHFSISWKEMMANVR